LNRIFKPLVFVLAGIYFLVDVVFFTIAKPIARWLADHWIFNSLRTWIVSLRPYPTLALFAVPVIILEPVKPIAAYLAATDHIVGGLTVLVIGEILKLVIIERLFRVCRDKLMTIRGFARCYDKACVARNWVESLEAWRLMRRWTLIARRTFRSHLLKIRAPQKQYLSWQSR
jgi:hypothetical protein